MQHTRVVEYIVEQLGAHGVTHIFGVDGANIEDLFDAAYFRPEITTVLAKHEFSAATMADAYGRCGPTIGVVAATSGGGCLNLVPGLGESLASRVPVLALVGQAPTTTDGLGSFQDTSGRNGALDAVALFGAVSVYCRRVTTPAAILDALPEAIAAARCGGPAVLLLPKDIQQAEIEIRDVRRVPGRAAGRVPGIAPGSPIVAALTSGPVTIVAGEQVARDDARAELERLRTALQAHIACVPDAKDVAIPAASLAGTMGHPATAAAVRDSAVCLLVGTRLPLTGRGGLEDALEHTEVVSIGSSEPYVPATHLHSDDLRISLQALVTALEAPGRPGAVRPERWTELTPPACGHAGVRYRDIMRALDEALPDDTDIVVDAGNTGAAAVHHLPHRRGGRFVVALGMGGMGYSFGAAVGVACARGKRTVVIAGDGSFYMHGLELHTAIQHRLPITYVLLNNNAHAMCVTREQLFYANAHSYNRFGPSRLAAGLAAMFPGLPATDVDEPGGLPAVLTSALSHSGPAVVSIECSADEIPPFAPFLAALDPGAGNHITAPEEVHAHVPASA